MDKNDRRSLGRTLQPVMGDSVRESDIGASETLAFRVVEDVTFAIANKDDSGECGQHNGKPCPDATRLPVSREHQPASVRGPLKSS